MSSQTNKSDENIFDILENDIAAFSKLGKCMIYGDFNARTGIHPDFCLDDDSPVNYFNTRLCWGYGISQTQQWSTPYW